MRRLFSGQVTPWAAPGRPRLAMASIRHPVPGAHILRFCWFEARLEDALGCTFVCGEGPESRSLFMCNFLAFLPNNGLLGAEIDLPEGAVLQMTAT